VSEGRKEGFRKDPGRKEGRREGGRNNLRLRIKSAIVMGT
jgi:hypothetical protein